MILGLSWLEDKQGILNLTRHVLYVGRETKVTAPLLRAFEHHGDQDSIFHSTVQHGLKGPHLEILLKLLRQHTEVFVPLSQGLSQTRAVKYEMRVTSDQPFRLPIYRYSDQKHALIEEQVQEMLADGITEQTSSPYSSPVVLTRKKNGKTRFIRGLPVTEQHHGGLSPTDTQHI